jgi:ComF family protein
MQNMLMSVVPDAGCFLCRTPVACGFPLCEPCWQALPRIAHPCPTCAMPLPDGLTDLQCGACQAHPSEIDWIYAPFLYGTPFRELIHAHKFHQITPLGNLLAQVLFREIGKQLASKAVDYLVPVPLAPARIRNRGFNQSLEVSRYLAKWSGIPVADQWVLRKDSPRSQVGLTKTDRKLALRNLFEVPRSLQGLSILLIDDVVTTGSTVQELARMLRKAGAKQIGVCAVARAV